MIFFTSDVHFGHTNVIRYNDRPFATRTEMDEYIVRRWNEKVSPEDTVYILGDLLITENAKRYLPLLQGEKILIRGNHDYFAAKEKNLAYFEEVKYMDILDVDGHPYTLCHYPMLEWKGSRRDPSEDGYGYLLYGHIHNNIKGRFRILFESPNAFNVGMDVNGYEPVTLEELQENNRVFRKRALEILSVLPEEERTIAPIREMRLADEPFYKIVRGEKTAELRLNDEKRRKIQVGDVLRLRRSALPSEYVHVQVKSLTAYPTFDEAFAQDAVLSGAGLTGTLDAKGYMRSFYSEEEERACGVLCIGIEKY